MPQTVSSIAVVLEKLAEFDRTAAVLDMPRGERLNILNVSEETYIALRSGRIRQSEAVTPELERRLSYALPLMRRLAKEVGQPRAMSSSNDAVTGSLTGGVNPGHYIKVQY
jgi:hypothetical protein